MGCGASVGKPSVSTGTPLEMNDTPMAAGEHDAFSQGAAVQSSEHGEEGSGRGMDHAQQLENALQKMMLGKDGGGFIVSGQTQRFSRKGGGDWTAFVDLEVNAWWAGLHGSNPKDEEYDLALQDCLRALSSWPRGDAAGEFLLTPQLDNTPVGQRGVSAEWCAAAFDWLGSIASAGPHTVSYLPTRVFVNALTKLLTAGFECSLWAFIPPHHRGIPTEFISHSWDCTLRSLFYHHLSPCRWLDFFAVNQHHSDTEVRSIGEIVQNCNRTVVMMEGMNGMYYALRPFLRSWCIYEITHTPKTQLSIQVGIFNMEMDYHRTLVESISDIRVERAEALRSADKEMIDDLVLKKYKTWDMANYELHLLALDTFADWYLNEQLGSAGAPIARLYQDKANALRAGHGGVGRQVDGQLD